MTEAGDAAPQRVIVTGASRGIGRAIVRRLVADGYDVVGVARTKPQTFEGTFHAIDLAAADAPQALRKLARETGATRLVANAGISAADGVETADDATFEAVMRMNVQSVLWSMSAVTPAMRAAHFGRIVVIGSRAALGKPDRVSYATSKAALGGLVRTAALELGRDGITVNIVAPGPIDTEMFAKHQPEGSPARAAIVGAMPVGRVGKPDEVAAAVAYFLDKRAGFTTGQTLQVCGGLTVGAAP